MMILTCLLSPLLFHLTLVTCQGTPNPNPISPYYKPGLFTRYPRDVLHDTFSVVNMIKKEDLTVIHGRIADVQWLKDFAPLLAPLYVMHNSYTKATIIKYGHSNISRCYRYAANFSLDPLNVRYDRPGLSERFCARRAKHLECFKPIKRSTKTFAVSGDFSDHPHAARSLQVDDNLPVPCGSHIAAATFNRRTLHILSMALIVLSRSFADSMLNSLAPFPSPHIRNYVLRDLHCMEDAFHYANDHPSPDPKFPKGHWSDLLASINALIIETDIDHPYSFPLEDLKESYPHYDGTSPGIAVYHEVLSKAEVDMTKWGHWFVVICIAANVKA